MDNVIFAMLALVACAAAAGGAMIYLLELLWKKQVLPYIENRKNSSRDSLLAIKGNQSNEELVVKYVELYDNTSFNRVYSKFDNFCANLLVEMLERSFIVEKVRQNCDLKGQFCTYIYKVIDGETKTEFLIYNQVSKNSYADNDHRPRYALTNGGNIEDYVYSEDIELASSLEVIAPMGASIDGVMECINSAAVERVSYQDIQIEKNAQVYRLSENHYGQIELIRVWQPVQPIKTENLDSLYAPIECEIDNTKVFVQASKCLDIAVDAMRHGENLYLRGPWGTGKSTYAGQLQHKLSNTDGVKVILVTATQFMDLYKSGNQGRLISELSPDPTGKNLVRNVIFIDEAELLTSVKDQKAISMLRSMLDGELKNQLNCSICLIFNSKLADLDAGLMRPGRKNLVYNINTLNEQQAWNAVKVLRNSMAHKVFNKEKFDSLLNSVNSVEGVKYAEKGYLALADIAISCFQRKDYRARVIDAIKAAANKQEPIKKFIEKTAEKSGNASQAPKDSNNSQQSSKKKKGMVVKFPIPQTSSK